MIFFINASLHVIKYAYTNFNDLFFYDKVSCN